MLSPVPERESLYRVLQVDPGANQLVIQAAYRVLARIFHPDVEGDDGEMKRLNQAWAILGDPRLRAEYDRQLAGRHHGPATATAATAPTTARAKGNTATGGGVDRSSALQSRPARPDDHAGPPQGEPFGPLL